MLNYLFYQVPVSLDTLFPSIRRQIQKKVAQTEQIIGMIKGHLILLKWAASSYLDGHVGP